MIINSGHVRLALITMRANRWRSLLTMFGIIVGVAINSPLLIERLTSSSARVVASPKPYSLLTSSILIKAILVSILLLLFAFLQILL